MDATAASARLAPLGDGSSWRWLVARAALVVWALVVLAYAAGLAITGTLGDVGCEKPPGSSNYGEIAFHALPPGLECRYGSSVDGPGLGTAVLQLVLVAVPVALWFASGRLAPGPRWGFRRQVLVLVLVAALLCGLGLFLGSFLASPTEPDVLGPFIAAAVLTAIAAAAALVWGQWGSRDHELGT